MEQKEKSCVEKQPRQKKGDTYESLRNADKKYASIAKRSESAQNSPWRKHVVNFSKKKKITYASALTDPDCKTTYVRVTKPAKPKSTVP